MAHFHIVHLADLHLEVSRDYPNRFPDVANNLIEHMSKQLKGKDNIIIIITGDIIHRGNYKDNKDLTLKFFKKLKEVFDENEIGVISVQIVPGNHDKDFDFDKNPEEPNKNKLLSVALQNIDEFNEQERDIRKLMKDSYDKYVLLRSAIYSTFIGDDGRYIKLAEKYNDTFFNENNGEYRTYGVDIVIA